MIGLGCINPGKMALITGSSHLHLAISGQQAGSSSSQIQSAAGVWGAYAGE